MKIEISIGELVDKVTILSIKLEKIQNTIKLFNIKKEFDLLYDAMIHTGITDKSLEFISLRKVNKQIWEYEDKIRHKEHEKSFDEEFIELSRNIYFENDKRSEIKKEINLKFQSNLIEEKEYINYKR